MNILIRKAKIGDAKGRADMWNAGIRNKFLTYTGSNNKKTKKDIKKWEKRIAAKSNGDFTFVAVDKKKNIIVGSASFSGSKMGRARHRGELGWIVHPDYSGQGIATKLVKAILKEAKNRGFKRAEAEAAIENIPSVKLAKKLGFSIEGIKKKGLLLDDGRYVDTYIFGKIIN